MKEPESGLQAEIGQSRPFLSLAQEATISILRTADVVRRQLAAVVESEGLTQQQYNVLRILRGARPDPLPTLEIRNRLIERSPGITRFLDHLEGKGLVRRERDPEDRRRVQCLITDAGLEVLARLDRAVDDADEAVVEELTTEEMSSLIRLLGLVRSRAS